MSRRPRMSEVFNIKEAGLANTKTPTIGDTQKAVRNVAQDMGSGGSRKFSAPQIATALKNTASELQKDPSKKFTVFNGQVAAEPEAGLAAVAGLPGTKLNNKPGQKTQDTNVNLLNPLAGKA